jgi:mRNA interferase HigB
VIRAGTWNNYAELKSAFGSADIVGRRTVFNIAHNKYRIVARVNYKSQRVFVLRIATHKEYSTMDMEQ